MQTPHQRVTETLAWVQEFWGVPVASRRRTPRLLRARWSAVYVLRHVEKLTLGEIAVTLGMSVWNVAYILRTIRRRADSGGWMKDLEQLVSMIRERRRKVHA